MFVLRAHAFRRAGAAVLAAALCSLLLALPETGALGVERGLRACYEVVIPSLFPFLFLTDALRRSLSGGSGALEAACALALGLVGGFPVGARGLAGCVKSGALTRERAALLLAGAVNAGPAFIITGIGLKMLGSARAGLYLFISLTLASILTSTAAVLFSRSGKRERDERRARHDSPRRLSGEDASLSSSLTFAVSATASLCGYVTLFSCASAYLSLALDSLGAAPLAGAAAFSLLEVTSGCAAAASLGGARALYLACAALSACGACVLSQVRAVCAEAEISMRPFFTLRPLHMALSHVILRGLLFFSPAVLPAALTLSNTASAFSLSAPSAAALFALSCAFLLCERRLSVFTNR